ncbi:MAG: DNA polymerase IV, partial [Patescibacteria group bacterium]
MIYSWPNVILHIDADAFFASVMQSIYPNLRNKPVVVGRERGIATAFSYEAKKLGVRRGMPIHQIKQLYPNCIIISSDYEMYSLYSRRMFEILHSFSPTVEEYSIDEGFADIKGLRRPLNKSYLEIGRAIQEKVSTSLGISVSIGISVTKSLAKLASQVNKPGGICMVSGKDIERFLSKIDSHKIWGVGDQTNAYLKKLEIEIDQYKNLIENK